jgi:hypothetical protein
VQEAEWASEPVWTQMIEEKSLPLTEIETRSSSLQSDAKLTELPQLLKMLYIYINVRKRESRWKIVG